MHQIKVRKTLIVSKNGTLLKGEYTCISKIEIFRNFIKMMYKNDFFIMNCVKNDGKKYLDVVWTPVLAKMRQKWVKNAVFS